MIRVGVNLTWLRPGEVGGSENYLVRLLGSIAELAPDDLELVLFVLPAFVEAHPELLEAFETHVAPVSGAKRAVRVIIESTWLPFKARRAKLTILHHAGGTTPIVRGTPALVTIHDLQYLDMAENFSKAKLRYLKFMVPLAVRSARLVIAPSDYSRQRILKAFGVDGVVVPHGIDALKVGEQSPVTFEKYVMYPAMTHPHKNHELLLRVLDELPELHLVLTGSHGDAHEQFMASVDRLGLKDRVHHLGVVPLDALGALYDAALAMTFPSLYEGFGAPPIEAMLAGCPVIASNSTCLPEVVGNGGILLDPGAPAPWVAAVSELISNSARRTELIEAGTTQARKFSPQNAAEAQLDAYRLAVSNLSSSKDAKS